MATDRALGASAETAQEIAQALLPFQAHVPEAATEISALISELFAISAALLELRTASNEPRNYRNRDLVDEDKYVVLKSLQYTFNDIEYFLRNLGSRNYRTNREAFQDVWLQINSYFREESNNSLLRRLGHYRRFIDGLTPLVEGRRPDPEIDELFDCIKDLLDIQDENLARDLDNLAVTTPRVPSWERVRGRPAASPGAGPARGGGRPGHHAPQSPVFDESPPQVPDPPPVQSPTSPSVTTSVSASGSHHSTPPSSAESIMPNHWLPKVFSQSRPTTLFKTTGSESSCYGEHLSGVTNKLKNTYNELLRVPFEDGHIEVRLYSRDPDKKARIYCRSERGNRRLTSCHPITMLRVFRKDSCLQICKPERRGNTLWSNLRFTSYERLILFYCCFLALKSQDQADPVRKLDEHILRGEKAVFSAVIIDDNYQHALQILKDEDSGGIRLQASVLDGPLPKRSPIWTAFINYKIASRHWARVAEPRKVHLGDLQRYIFSSDYIPQLGPHGEHELFFADRRDAQRFVETIDDLADGKYDEGGGGHD